MIASGMSDACLIYANTEHIQNIFAIGQYASRVWIEVLPSFESRLFNFALKVVFQTVFKRYESYIEIELDA